MLTGRRALVTGSAQGIGAGIVAALRQAGAEVMGLDRMADDGQIACDLADATQIEPAVALAARRMGGIDILVNNAAINEKRALAEIDLDHIDRMLARESARAHPAFAGGAGGISGVAGGS